MIGAALAVPYFYRRMDDEIRCRVETGLARQYPGLQVKVRSAALVQGEGIEVRGLTIIDPAADGPGAELLNFDECLFRCSTDLQELLTSEPEVTRVVIRRPTLRMTRRPDGSWSLARLLPLPKIHYRPPEVTVENGTIEVFDPVKTPSTTMTLRDVNLTLVPPPVGSTSHCRKLQGTLAGDYVRQVSFEGEVDPHRPELTIQGTVEGVDIGPELRDTLPCSPSGNLSLLSALRGQGDMSFGVRYDPSSPSPWQVESTARLVRGRIDDPRLPHPLTDVCAVVRLNNEGFSIEDLLARSNQATLRVKCRGSDAGPSRTFMLEAEVRQLELDQRFSDALEGLPGDLRAHWRNYRPEGRIDADVKLAYDGRRWQPEVRVRCLDVSFIHPKFPYRLEHGKGTLFLKDDVLQLNLAACTGQQTVRIDGQLHHPGPQAFGWVEAKGEEIPLDKKLMDAMEALPQRSRAVYRALNPRGAVDFEYAAWRKATDEKFHHQLALRVNGCSIKYEPDVGAGFPYPISNIRGTMLMRDGDWEFRGLEGTNGVARISADGALTAKPEGHVLALHLAAADVPLDDDLRKSLKPAMRQVWDVVKPRGTIDLTADLSHLDATNRLDLTVRARPKAETCSIEPLAFPYRLEKLQGMLEYSGGQVKIERFKAEHGPVKVAAGGSCGFLPDGGWHLRLDGLTVDRLHLDRDRELRQALPARLRKAIEEINPSGPISLRGKFELARAGLPGDPVRSQWDFGIGLQQAVVDCPARLENIHGSLRVVGGFDGTNFHAGGELAIDSLNYKDYQITQVMGPFWIDDQQVLLGSWVERLQNQGPLRDPQAKRGRPLTAKLFGGTLCGDAWIALGQRPSYRIQASLVEAELARWAQEVPGGKQNLRGRVLATLDLRGNGRSGKELTGHGNVQLRNANVYELPLMVSMLKILSIRAPDPNAFSKGDMDFRIEGEHLYFDKLDFTGDAISLLGKGEMDFQKKLRLTFTAIVGRGELGMPTLKRFFTGASQQFMQVHVGGSLHEPEVRKEAFPAVNQALQQLQDRR